MIKNVNSTLAEIIRYMDEWKIKGDPLLIHDDNNNQFENGRGYKLLPVKLINDN